jgi:hypothetical protein
MALQYSVTTRNAILDAIEVAIGTSPIMKVRTGAAPTNCAAADTGTVLATLNLPSDWLGGASAGAKALAGTWQDTSADNSGTAGHFRIYDSSGTTCHVQGSVSDNSGTGDLKIDNVIFAAGQQFAIPSFTISAGNA